MAQQLSTLVTKDRFTAVGLMSGTSMDGVDAALVSMDADAENPSVELVEFSSLSYPDELRAALADAAFGHSLTAEEISTLHTGVAVTFAGSFFEVCRRAGLSPSAVDFIGSHGQTVAHAPPSSVAADSALAGTLQLGPPGMIAALTEVTTVGDFRVGDIALGGQGAPLAPCADFLLRRSPRASRVILNMGGIANVTYLPRGCSRADVIAFDTGPGNMVLDELYRVLFAGSGPYDEGGVSALRGAASADLLDELLAHPYFTLAPPKSAGHREFGAQFAWRLRTLAESHGVDRDDTLATAAALTAATIADGLERFVAPKGGVDELYLTGGGAHNAAIVSALRERIEGVEIHPIDVLGVSADAKEAVDFAVLARETLFGRPNALSAATGATRDLVLGSIAWGGAA